jgi:phage recombination protein Bet
MNDRTLPATISAAVPALNMSEQELITVLQSSLYPGAKLESIKLVLGYCKAAGLDPMQKPVHIVPLSIKQDDGYAMRDVVMPGIGLYRTQASRTGEYAGVTEPEFGPTKQLKSGEFSLDYPEWCRVTVKRQMASGDIVEFTANERWLENYATQKRDTIVPNAMWKRRPFAQLAKCAEAQALRKAFPELGAAPTADEMEGKEIHQEIDVTPTKPAGPQPYADDQFTKNFPSWEKLIKTGKKTAEQIIATVSSKAVLSDAQRASIVAIKKDEGGAPAFSYAQLASRLQGATDVDVLDADADLISAVKNPEQRKELEDIYQTKRAELSK